MMADFCRQCSEEIFGEDFRELAGLISEEKGLDGEVILVLCEGCGTTVVDHTGTCQSSHCLKKHKE